jgi:hypothetical protein
MEKSEAHNLKMLQIAANELNKVAKKYGMKISSSKTNNRIMQ